MRGSEVIAVRRVVAAGVVGYDVGRPCGDIHRAREVDLLPATRTLVGEGRGREQGARGRPQIRHMGARVLRALVESDPRDRAIRKGLELDAEFHRTVVAYRYSSWRVAGREQRLRRRRVVDRD